MGGCVRSHVFGHGQMFIWRMLPTAFPHRLQQATPQALGKLNLLHYISWTTVVNVIYLCCWTLLFQFSSSFGNGCGDSQTSSHHLILVGNKTDQVEDRMVTYEEGEKRSRDLGCDLFFEISVREEADAARRIVESLYSVYKQQHGGHQQQQSPPTPFGRRCLETFTGSFHRPSNSMDIINERSEDASILPIYLSLGKCLNKRSYWYVILFSKILFVDSIKRITNGTCSGTNEQFGTSWQIPNTSQHRRKPRSSKSHQAASEEDGYNSTMDNGSGHCRSSGRYAKRKTHASNEYQFARNQQRLLTYHF